MKRLLVLALFCFELALAQTLGILPLQQALRNPELPPAQKLRIYQALIDAHLQDKSYELVVQTAEQTLVFNPAQPFVRLQQAQALALLGRDALAIEAVKEKMRLDALVPIKPSEAELRLLARSYARLKNKPAVQQSLIQLLTHYPQSPNARAYWQDLLTQRIDELQSVDKPDKRVIYGFYRLLQATGNLTEADDIAEAAMLAIDAGQPREALEILSLGKNLDSAQLKIKERAERLAKTDERSNLSQAPWETPPTSERWQELASLWRLQAK